MTRRGLAGLAVAAASMTIGAATLAPPALPRQDTTVYVAAASASGRPVTDLTASDFAMTSDGQPIAVTAATRPSASMSVVFLLDLSQSAFFTITASPTRALANDVHQFMTPAVRPDDRLRVGVVSSRPAFSLIPAKTGAVRRVFSEMLDVPEALTAGPSPLWDAVDAAVTTLRSEPAPRAVILLTDGRVTGSRLGLPEVGEHAMLAGVMVSVVHVGGEQFVPQGRTPGGEVFGARIRSDVHVRALADSTGGVLVPARPPSPIPGGSGPASGPGRSIGAIFANLLVELREMYSLSFSAPVADGRLHRLEVLTTRPDVTVRAPRGYVAPNGQETRR